MSLQGVLFDLDDTLADLSSVERLVQAPVGEALAGAVPGLDLAVMTERYESSFDRHWDAYVASGTDFRTYRWNLLAEAIAPWADLDEELYRVYRTAKSGHVDDLRLYPDAVETIRALRGRGLAVGILTNGPSALQRRKLEVTGLATEVEAIAVSEELGMAKPDPAAFHAAVGMLRLQPAAVAMVGDSPVYDMAGALCAGLAAAVWIQRGTRRALEGTVTVSSLAEVPAALGF
jgi:putative hydrolase of the HAD superfamily